MEAAIATTGEFDVVGDQDQRGAALFPQAEQQLDYLMPGALIQISRGFIGEKHPGLRGEGAGDGDTLLFAARELVGIMLKAGAQTHCP